MLNVNSRVNLIRKRSAAHKVYVPANVRENQYLLVEFKPNQALVESICAEKGLEPNVADFYRILSHRFFNLCETYKFSNVSFIAKNKLVRVMYATEQQVIETKQQLLFMYDPKQHTGLRTFLDTDMLSHKIEFLFLATGDEVRFNAPKFHQRVSHLMTTFSKLLTTSVGSFKVRDHQHLTYDIFSKQKGVNKTIVHGFRPISQRYQDQAMLLPRANLPMTFAVATLPINHSLLTQCDIDETAEDPYNPVYTYVSDLFVKIAKTYNLNHLAVIANGKVPIIRQDNEDYVVPQGELVHLGFKPRGSGGSFVCQWDSQNLVDSIKLVFVASNMDQNKRGYGKFVNHLTQVLAELSSLLGYKKDVDPIMLRFHQHLVYNLAKVNVDG